LVAGQDAVVIGGGNAGFESAAQLLDTANQFTLVHRSAEFSKADPLTVEAVLKDLNEGTHQHRAVEIRGASL